MRALNLSPMLYMGTALIKAAYAAVVRSEIS